MGVPVSEVGYPLHQIRIVHLFLELLTVEVGEADEEVHQYRYGQALVDELEQRLYDVLGEFRLFLEVGEAPSGVDDIGQHSRGEVQAERVDFDLEGFLDQRDRPVDHVVVDEGLNQAFLNAALLEDGQAESLSYVAVFLLLENLR